jgi:hypothetical protein
MAVHQPKSEPKSIEPLTWAAGGRPRLRAQLANVVSEPAFDIAGSMDQFVG